MPHNGSVHLQGTGGFADPNKTFHAVLLIFDAKVLAHPYRRREEEKKKRREEEKKKRREGEKRRRGEEEKREEKKRRREIGYVKYDN